MAVPVLRVYEDIICHHYYDRLQGEGHVVFGGDIDESMCKKDDIQNELSILVAGTHFLGAIPGLFLTIPYGMLMDRIGRKPIFMLAITGIILNYLWNISVMWFWHTLPLRLIWLGPIFTIIGGGPSVGGMAFFAIASDTTTEAKRTHIFFLAAAADLVAQLIAPSLAAVLMAKSPWIPILLGISFVTLGSLLILFVPETLHMQHQRTSASHVALATSDDGVPHNCNTKTSLFATMKHEFSNTLRILRSSFSILNSAPLLLLLLTFIVNPLTSQSVDISLRYISNRFHFPLRLSSFLWSLRAAVQIILFLLILPFLSKIMIIRFNIPSSKKDLHLARTSILIFTLGSLLIAIAPTLPLAILGMVVSTLGQDISP
ncbi:MFS multidrug transporter [Botrytis cinerea]